MRILLVDDHDLVRIALAKIIKENFPAAFLEEVKNGFDALTLARLMSWDLIITDQSMPKLSGLDMLTQLRAESNETPVLVLSIHPKSEYSKKVRKAKGNGYLSKDCQMFELVQAVQTIYKGGLCFSKEEFPKHDSLQGSPVKLKHELISDRELQVLKMITQGKTVSEMAEKLSLKPPTVNTYRARLLKKMKCANDAELASYGHQHDLSSHD